MKFTKSKIDGLMGGVESHWVLEEKEPGFEPFEIVASIQGIQFRGRSTHISTVDDLETLARTVGAAANEHKALMRAKIHINESH